MTSPRIGSPKPSTRTNNTGISDCRKLQRNSASVPTAQDARPCDVGPGAASRSAFHLNTRGLGRLVLLGGLLIFLSACASVRSGPFEQFAKNTQSLQTNVENALKVGAGDAQARFLADATQDPSKAQDLLLQPDPSDAFNYQSEDLPLFLTAQRFRARVVDATGVVSEYASALLQLASPDLLSQQEFDEMSKNINADAAKAALAISDQSRPPAAGIGLISTAAGAIFRQFLESKRKKALLRALQANHSTVESYARLLEEATLIAADMAWREYDAKATLRLNAIGDAAGSGEGTITEDLQQLIKLNQDQLAHLEALKALRDAFAALPASHAGLIQALQDPKSGTEAIDLVLQQSRRLEVQYQRSLSDVYLASAQSMAQKAEVQASLAATRASSAEAKAALAKEKAILARSQANLDPSDAQKQAAAQEAETNAQQLQTVAEQLRQTATEAQESAEAAQEVVQRLQEQAQSSGTSQ